MHMCTCMYVCMYVYIYIYTYIHTIPYHTIPFHSITYICIMYPARPGARRAVMVCHISFELVSALLREPVADSIHTSIY